MKKSIILVRELLPFTIELATDAPSLSAAVQIRQAAYARHLPDVAKTMVAAESWDFREGAAVMVARSKLDGAAIGSMRVHTNEFTPLPLEQSYTLPDVLTRLRLVEATRLAVAGTAGGTLVKTALLKAGFMYCQAVGAAHLVITARHPLDRMYERLLFKDVRENAGYLPMEHVGGLPHRVMHMTIKDADERWKAASHPQYRFMFETDHPDIRITGENRPALNASNEAVMSDRA